MVVFHAHSTPLSLGRKGARCGRRRCGRRALEGSPTAQAAAVEEGRSTSQPGAARRRCLDAVRVAPPSAGRQTASRHSQRGLSHQARPEPRPGAGPAATSFLQGNACRGRARRRRCWARAGPPMRRRESCGRLSGPGARAAASAETQLAAASSIHPVPICGPAAAAAGRSAAEKPFRPPFFSNKHPQRPPPPPPFPGHRRPALPVAPDARSPSSVTRPSRPQAGQAPRVCGTPFFSPVPAALRAPAGPARRRRRSNGVRRRG
jgi:hypothetical protein